VERSHELAVLRRKIDRLGRVYAALFALAAGIVLLDCSSRAPLIAHLPWVAALAGAVVTRIARQKLEVRHDTLLWADGRRRLGVARRGAADVMMPP
jgi:hypothetical protein